MRLIYLTFLLIFFSHCILSAQVISEIHIDDEGKWFIEITNPDGQAFNKLNLAVKDSLKTVGVKQTIVDSLQKKDALVVITADSLIGEVNYYNKDYIYCVLDDNINIIDGGLLYMEPVDVKVDQTCGSSIVCSYSYIYWGHPIKGESIVRLDSTGYECSPQYTGRGMKSLGRLSTNEDVFVEITGEIVNSDCFNENITFNSGWKDVECVSSFQVNTENKFTFITAPYGSEKSISYDHEYNVSDKNGCVYDGHSSYPNNYAGYWVNIVPLTSLEEGAHPVDLFIGKHDVQFEVVYIASTEELQKLTSLSCSPNPATEKITVEYSIPQEANWKECSIMLSNQQGQALQQKRLENQEGKQTISLPPSLEKGIYYCSLMYKGQVLKTEKIVVK